MLLPNDFLKASIIIHCSGQQAFRHTKNMQRVRRGARLPTLRQRVVQCIAEAAKLYISQAPTLASEPAAAAFSSPTIDLHALYLLALYRYGRTLIPVLGYIPTTHVTATPFEIHLLTDLMGSLWDS